ncbi:MAG: adenosylcobinamide-GDP ribazoletransferase [Clostridia bacterium]|nr:adenosylcobinamide-GDP ribazoletransferase [Clostridia bacterium]
MNLIYSIFAAFSMFSALPAPQVPWEKEKIRYMLVALPLVGLVIGAAEYLWLRLCSFLALGMVLSAVGFTLIPVLLTGGIHLDGFMDTVDALKSHAAPEKKRAILKDPHAGAFASIGLACYLLAWFGLCADLPLYRRTVLLLGLIHVMSRGLSAVSGTLLPVRPGEGTLNFFHQAADRTVGAMAVGWVILSAAAMVIVWPLVGGVMALGAVATLLLVRRMAMKEFQGMSGDIAGFQLQVAELVMLTLLVLTERMVGL